MEHFVSATCEGEVCRMCGEKATHKVGEEIAGDDPAWREVVGHTLLMRHNYTSYVCCKHFKAIFGESVPCATPNMELTGGAAKDTTKRPA